MAKRYLIGVDEAGRGPLAGPVAVGAVLFTPGFDWRQMRGVRDSKQLTERAREAWYARAEALADEQQLYFSVAFSSARKIDRSGIVPSISAALERVLRTLIATATIAPDECEVLLDGSLYAPNDFIHQRTIIRGDETEPIISLASIAAKVERDRLMLRMAKKFPAYGFNEHKGYGTKKHISMIRQFGLCDIHRRSFIHWSKGE